MKILLVSPFLPHTGARHAGGKVVHFLYSTLARTHEVALVTRFFPEERDALETLREGGRHVSALAAPGPWFRGGALTLARTIASYRALCRLAERVAIEFRPDVCQVECTETGYFWRPGRMPPSLLSCWDLVAKRLVRQAGHRHGLAGVATRPGALAQRFAERYALRKFAEVFLLSQIEAEWCRRLYPGVRASVLHYPGGVGFTGMPRREIPGRVLFVGALGRPQNVEGIHYLLRKVWPTVRREVPSAELLIVGSGASPELLAEVAATPGARALGEVERVEPSYTEAAVFAAPILTGGGIIVKILDALAARVPVVTTPYGNEGIEAPVGSAIRIADAPETFAGAVVELLRDDGLRRRVGEAGQVYVKRAFPAEGLSNQLESAYRAALDRAGRPRPRLGN